MKKLVSKYKGYTFYEYLESHGREVILLDYIPNANTLTEFGLYLSSETTYNAIPHIIYTCTSYKNEDTTAYARYGLIKNGQYGYRFDYASSISWANIGISIYNKWSNISIYKGLKIDNYTLNYGELSDNILCNHKLCVFSGCYDGSYSTTTYKAACKIDRIKISEVNSLKLDLVPASNGTEYGLYDLVNDVFYTNKGTGTFSVGEQINIEVEVEEVKGRWNTKNLVYNCEYNNRYNWMSDYEVLTDGIKFVAPANNRGFIGIKWKVPQELDNKTIYVRYFCFKGDSANTAYMNVSPYKKNGVVDCIDENTTSIQRSGIVSSKGIIKYYKIVYQKDNPYIYFDCFNSNAGYIQTEDTDVEVHIVIGLSRESCSSYVPYIQTAKEIKTIRPSIPSIYGNIKTKIVNVDIVVRDTIISYNGIKNASYGSQHYNMYLKEGYYLVTCKCTRNNSNIIADSYIQYKNSNNNLSYIMVSHNSIVGSITKTLIHIRKDMYETGKEYCTFFAQMNGVSGNFIDYEMDLKVQPIVSAKEIKTKVNGEIKTINLDYELAEDVEPSLLSLDEEDNNNSDTDAPDTI